MAREHVIDSGRVHHRWDSSLEPTLAIESGDTVDFELAMAGRSQVELGASFEETAFDWETLYNLLGPIWVAGAEPGQSLEIEILHLEPGPWGWTVILPDLGLLPEDFPDPYLRTFELEGRTRVVVAPGIGVVMRPFLGTMGTHPGEPAVAPPFPPHQGGGNIDNRHLVVGSSLFLPIWCEGALFSCGDPHAAQGDGEVCVSAVECDMRATLRFTLHDRSISGPAFSVPPGLGSRDADGYLGAMGIAADLMEGAKAAVRALIAQLVDEHGLTREDAYVLASLAGDLHIHEIVDAGVWNVGFTLPRSVFAGG
jgi:acetamidase/formamidase